MTPLDTSQLLAATPAPAKTREPEPSLELPEPSGRHVRVCVISDQDERPEPFDIRPCDLLIACGDLADDTLRWYQQRLNPKRAFAVRGNHDQPVPLPDGFEALHGQKIEYAGLWFGGLDGCQAYKADAPFQYLNEEAETFLTAMGGVDILVTHNSPANVHERGDRAHLGFRALNDYLREHQPGYLFHGHQHTNRVSRYGNSWIVGTYGHRWVRLPLER